MSNVDLSGTNGQPKPQTGEAGAIVASEDNAAVTPSGADGATRKKLGLTLTSALPHRHAANIDDSLSTAQLTEFRMRLRDAVVKGVDDIVAEELSAALGLSERIRSRTGRRERRRW